MRSQFADYLASHGLIDRATARRAALEAVEFHEIIGAIALKHDLLGPDQVERVLLALSGEKKFGQVACELGLLTPTQVQKLLSIQEVQEVIEVGQSLILEGRLTRLDVLQAAVAFFEQKECSVVGATGSSPQERFH